MCSSIPALARRFHQNLPLISLSSQFRSNTVTCMQIYSIGALVSAILVRVSIYVLVRDAYGPDIPRATRIRVCA